MGMDITALFRTCVQERKAQNRLIFDGVLVAFSRNELFLKLRESLPGNFLDRMLNRLSSKVDPLGALAAELEHATGRKTCFFVHFWLYLGPEASYEDGDGINRFSAEIYMKHDTPHDEKISSYIPPETTYRRLSLMAKENGHSHNDKIKPHSRRRCPFITKCKEVANRISELKEFLIEHRKSYLSLGPDFLHSSGTSSMTDKERDKVDGGAQAIIKTSSQLLTDLKRELYSKDGSDQVSDAHKAIVDLLESYLKSVTKIFTEMKAIRVKWTVEVQKMSKFESSADKPSDSEEKDGLKIERKTPEGTTFSPSLSSFSYEEDTPLSEEELQMFQMENDHLYNELNSLNEEVKSIQSKVVKIAELQEVFTEKVLEQNEDIERISSTLVGTTENLKDANSQIRKAIQSNASFRIYVLFFILMMSFCLLFLDWYND